MVTASPKRNEDMDFRQIDIIVNKYKGLPGELLSVLEEVQQSHQHKYLPEETIEYLAKKLKIPKVRLYAVVTFYAFFNLQPQGEHSIVICRGTACHTRNSRYLLESLGLLLGFTMPQLQEGNEKIFLTTKDKKFTIKTVACFGQCALAPVVEIDSVIYSNMTIQKLQKLVKTIAGKK